MAHLIPSGRRWLATPLSTTELPADLPLPPGEHIGAVMEVLQRGRAELNALVTAWA
ncbi:hypothetical protein [Streptacidiphilus jiangxiensis]|uniref:hypothetical protein n=1 Tax=Streptacidiphilus jiangxiensis TaxID=235985 RepID=UPI001378E277|nr:hypothetical protein [Streptacidiphilus jiangxiensis]